jgi:phage terminase large subunit-like protein
VLTRHIANCHTKSDRYGVRVTKEHRGSKRRIDAAVAAIMALEVAATLEPVIVPPTPRIF